MRKNEELLAVAEAIHATFKEAIGPASAGIFLEKLAVATGKFSRPVKPQGANKWWGGVVEKVFREHGYWVDSERFKEFEIKLMTALDAAADGRSF